MFQWLCSGSRDVWSHFWTALSEECQEIGLWDSIEFQIMSMLNEYHFLIQLCLNLFIMSKAVCECIRLQINHISNIRSPKLVRMALTDMAQGDWWINPVLWASSPRKGNPLGLQANTCELPELQCNLPQVLAESFFSRLLLPTPHPSPPLSSRALPLRTPPWSSHQRVHTQKNR